MRERVRELKREAVLVEVALVQFELDALRLPRAGVQPVDDALRTDRDALQHVLRIAVERRELERNVRAFEVLLEREVVAIRIRRRRLVVGRVVAVREKIL